MNVRGWTANTAEIKMKLCKHNDPDLICLAETHLAIDETIAVYGYRFYGKSRVSQRASGGVGILVKDTVYQNYLVEVCSNDTEGILALSLTHKRTGSVSVVIANISSSS